MVPRTACCYLCGERLNVQYLGHELVGLNGEAVLYRHFDLDYCRAAAERKGRAWQPCSFDDAAIKEPGKKRPA